MHYFYCILAGNLGMNRHWCVNFEVSHVKIPPPLNETTSVQLFSFLMPKNLPRLIVSVFINKVSLSHPFVTQKFSPEMHQQPVKD